MKLKVFLITAVIIIVLMISGTYIYVNWDNILLDKNGYTIDWNDPWQTNDGIYYYCRILEKDGSITEKWLPESTAKIIDKAKKRGIDISVR